MIRKQNFFSALLVIFFLLIPTIYAQTSKVGGNVAGARVSKTSQLPYKHGRVIVKLKDTFPESLQHLMSEKKGFGVGKTNLNRIAGKYKIHKARAVFRSERDEQEMLKQNLKLTTKNLKAYEENKVRNVRQKNLIRSLRVKNKRAPVNFYHVYVLEMDNSLNVVEEAVKELKADPDVEYVQPDYEMVPYDYVPTDPMYGELWGLKKMELEKVWGTYQGEYTDGLGNKKSVVVAVLDTGVDYNHPDIWDNIWVNPDVIHDVNHDGVINLDDADLNYNKKIEINEIKDHMFGWDFSSDRNDPKDVHYHGTHVAGIIAAVGNNIGVIGVAPKAKIMALQALGGGSTEELAQGITYAVDHGADIINNSWGCRDACPSQPYLEAVIRNATDAGVINIFAAGNENDDVMNYSPQNMPEVITVAATDSLDQRASFSNGGYAVDIAAPGVSILSLVPNGQYQKLNGTSMAAPHVAGLAALILSKNPNLKNEEVEQLFHSFSDDITPKGFDFGTGFGRINASKSMNYKSVPIVKLDEPQGVYTIDSRIASFEIRGSAYGSTFLNYQLFYSPWDDGINWTPILSTPALVPVINNTLGRWDTSGLPKNDYLLKLTVATTDSGVFDEILPVYYKNKFTQVTHDFLIEISPVASEDWIVWIQSSLFTALNQFNNIQIYNVHTGIQKILPVIGWISNLNISETTLLWEAYEDGHLSLYTYDINRPEQGAVKIKELVNTMSGEAHARIDGNKVVWKENDEYGNGNIFVMNLTTQEIEMIIDNSRKNSPYVSDHYVAWLGILPNESVYKLFIQDLSTKQTRTVDTQGSIVRAFKMNYPWIVWHDDEFIYAYDLRLNKVVNKISAPGIFSDYFSVSSQRIIWTERDYLGQTIYLFDFPSNTKQRFISSLSSILSFYTSKNIILWSTDTAYGNYTLGGDLFMAKTDVQDNDWPSLSLTSNYKEVPIGEQVKIDIEAVDLKNRNLTLDGKVYDNLKSQQYDDLNSIGASLIHDQINKWSIIWKPNELNVGLKTFVVKANNGLISETKSISIRANVFNRIPEFGGVSPDNDGEKIAFFSDGDGYGSLVALYDVTKKRMETIRLPVINGISVSASDLGINNNRLIYQYGHLILYDLSKRIEETIYPEEVKWPHMDGDFIVWALETNGQTDIYLYQISNKHLIPLTNDTANQMLPKISGNNIVWQSNQNGNWDIYAYDITTQQTRQITFDPSNQQVPSISQTKIVWLDSRNNGSKDVYFYDLLQGKEERLTTVSSIKGAPDIDGNLIVWSDTRNREWDIYLYDLQSKQERPITRADGIFQANPKIKGNLISIYERYGIDYISYYKLINKNEKPVVEYIPDQNVNLGQTLTFQVRAIDPEYAPIKLTAILSNGDSISTINASFVDHGNGTGTFQWIPAVNHTASPYVVVFTAIDQEGLIDSKASLITVQSSDETPPKVIITSPKNGSVVKLGAKTAIQVSATDNVGVGKVEIYVNNVLICTDNIVPYACTWVTGSGSSFNIVAKAYDTCGNVGKSPIIKVMTGWIEVSPMNKQSRNNIVY